MSGTTPRFKAAIFDMDGVLVDTEAFYIDQLRAFCAAFDLSISDDGLLAQVGASHQHFQRLLARLLEEGGRGAYSPQGAEDVYIDWARTMPTDFPSLLNPGVPETIQALLDCNVRVALASSGPYAIINEALTACQILDKFELVVSGQDFIESKPNPEIYLHTVERLGLKSDECCCIEDSVVGIQAGKAAGITVIAKREERFGFSQDEADYIADSIPDILPIIVPNYR